MASLRHMFGPFTFTWGAFSTTVRSSSSVGNGKLGPPRRTSAMRSTTWFSKWKTSSDILTLMQKLGWKGVTTLPSSKLTRPALKTLLPKMSTLFAFQSRKGLDREKESTRAGPPHLRPTTSENLDLASFLLLLTHSNSGTTSSPLTKSVETRPGRKFLAPTTLTLRQPTIPLDLSAPRRSLGASVQMMEIPGPP